MQERLGIAGTGAIGANVARAVDRGAVPEFSLCGIAASRPERLDALNRELTTPVPLMDFDALAENSDWVLEALPPRLFEQLARPVLSRGKTLVVASGAKLLYHSELIELAQQNGARIKVPSGAMLGLDAVKAAAVGEISSVTIETRKPVAGLISAPYIKRVGLELEGLTEPLLIIEGSVTEVAQEFPANVNVAAALSLAGLGPDRTRIEVWADPTLTRNKHSVRVTSDSSDFVMSIQNRPSDENAATGRITPLSVIALLRNYAATLQIGT